MCVSEVRHGGEERNTDTLYDHHSDIIVTTQLVGEATADHLIVLTMRFSVAL
jgi:hypothetical protein